MAEKEHEEHSSGGSHAGGPGGGGHGGGSHEEHEGAPEWLISFADNVALMMGFFVILLAMNMKEPTTGGIGGREQFGGKPNEKMLDFAIAMRNVFHVPPDPNDPNDAALIRRQREKAEGGQSQQPEEPGAGRESQTVIPTRVSSLGGLVPFEDDADSLSPSGKRRAEEIALKLKGLRYIVEVRGHASPSETARSPELGAALSYARALAVARVLTQNGVAWSQVRLTACGDSERNIARDYDRDNDRLNQRVEVIVTGDQAPDPAGNRPGLPAATAGPTAAPAAPAGDLAPPRGGH
jgi:outer membrane protein OmpA-like peptidoglycan-associated protein